MAVKHNLPEEIKYWKDSMKFWKKAIALENELIYKEGL